VRCAASERAAANAVGRGHAAARGECASSGRGDDGLAKRDAGVDVCNGRIAPCDLVPCLGL